LDGIIKGNRITRQELEHKLTESCALCKNKVARYIETGETNFRARWWTSRWSGRSVFSSEEKHNERYPYPEGTLQAQRWHASSVLLGRVSPSVNVWY